MDAGVVAALVVVVIALVVLAIFGSLKATGRASRMCLARHKPEYLVDEDISNGREKHGVPAISYMRTDKTPLNFHYVTDHVQCESNMQVDTRLTSMNCCQCQDDCTGANCACSKGQLCERFYNPDGTLAADFKLDAPEIIRECNMACKCNRRLCKNMVIQAGCQARLILFRTKSRGWGVRTLENLARGTFIGVYSGELVSVNSSQQREDDTYLFNLSSSHIATTTSNTDQPERPEVKRAPEMVVATDVVDKQEQGFDMGQTEAEVESEYQDLAEAHQVEQGESNQAVESEQASEETKQSQVVDSFVCDAKFFGNFTRFINHSCDPNVVGIRTFTSHQDQRFPHISFFTNKNIPANTELTLNYGDSYWLVKCKRDQVYCLCRRSKCKFNKQTLANTLKEHNIT